MPPKIRESISDISLTGRLCFYFGWDVFGLSISGSPVERSGVYSVKFKWSWALEDWSRYCWDSIKIIWRISPPPIDCRGSIFKLFKFYFNDVLSWVLMNSFLSESSLFCFKSLSIWSILDYCLTLSFGDSGRSSFSSNSLSSISFPTISFFSSSTCWEWIWLAWGF